MVAGNCKHTCRVLVKQLFPCTAPRPTCSENKHWRGPAMADGVVLHKHPSDSTVEPAAHTDVVQHDSECYWLQQQARIKAVRTRMNVGQSLGVSGCNELFGYIGVYQNHFGGTWCGRRCCSCGRVICTEIRCCKGVAKSGWAGSPAPCHSARLAP